MRKADLKTGMRIQYSNQTGNRIVIRDEEYNIHTNGGGLILSKSGGWLPLSSFTEDLEKSSDSLGAKHRFTIMKVFACPNLASMLEFESCGELLWEREPEAVEMTMEEVCKELGKNVKIKKQ